MDRLIAEDRILFGPDDTSTVYFKRYLDEQTDETVGSVFERDRRASTAYLKSVLSETRFPNPKDHEVLKRWIRIVAPADATVVDFFGGSGTTTEAVMRLNDEDGGTRQSILVTNNEVGAKQAKDLRKAGHHPGDPEWEAKGVFEYVTRPRISIVVTGKRPDASSYSDGLAANVEFLDLTYLDPGMVRRGREFQAIASLIWLRAGAVGERIDSIPESGWALTASYGILFDLDALAQFATAVADAAIGRAVHEPAVRGDRLRDRVSARGRAAPGRHRDGPALRGLLSNFTVNVEGGVR